MPSFTITEFDQIPSTNTWAKERISSFAKGSFQVISAKKQSGGRGRQGRSFISLEGGLYFTCAFEVPKQPHHLSALAIAMGAKVANYLGVNLKWPNDLVFQGKKLGGFLIEAVNSWWIVGFGINVNASEEAKKAHAALDIETAFLSEIEDSLDTSHSIKEKQSDLHTLKKEIARLVYETKEVFLEKGLSPFMPAIEKSLAHKKGDKIFVRIGKGEKVAALFEGISEKGELLMTRYTFQNAPIDQKNRAGKKAEKGSIERISQAEINE